MRKVKDMGEINPIGSVQPEITSTMKTQGERITELEAFKADAEDFIRIQKMKDQDHDSRLYYAERDVEHLKHSVKWLRMCTIYLTVALTAVGAAFVASVLKTMGMI